MKTCTRDLLIFATSDRWSSAIARYDRFQNVRVLSFRQLTDLESAFRQYPDCLGVIEIDAKFTTADASCLARLLRPSQLPAIAVGRHRLKTLRWKLIQTGFIDFLWSAAQLPRLASLAENFYENRASTPLSIEKQVARDLPW